MADSDLIRKVKAGPVATVAGAMPGSCNENGRVPADRPIDRLSAYVYPAIKTPVRVEIGPSFRTVLRVRVLGFEDALGIATKLAVAVHRQRPPVAAAVPTTDPGTLIPRKQSRYPRGSGTRHQLGCRPNCVAHETRVRVEGLRSEL